MENSRGPVAAARPQCCCPTSLLKPSGSGLGSPTAVSLPRHPGGAGLTSTEFEPRACLFQHPGPLTATAHPSAPGRLTPAFSGAARCGGRELTARAGFTLGSHEPCLRRDIPGKPALVETAAVLTEGQETCAPVPAWPPVPDAAVRPEVPAQCSLGPSEPGDTPAAPRARAVATQQRRRARPDTHTPCCLQEEPYGAGPARAQP